MQLYVIVVWILIVSTESARATEGDMFRIAMRGGFIKYRNPFPEEINVDVTELSLRGYLKIDYDERSTDTYRNISCPMNGINGTTMFAPVYIIHNYTLPFYESRFAVIIDSSIFPIIEEERDYRVITVCVMREYDKTDTEVFNLTSNVLLISEEDDPNLNVSPIPWIKVSAKSTSGMPPYPNATLGIKPGSFFRKHFEFIAEMDQLFSEDMAGATNWSPELVQIIVDDFESTMQETVQLDRSMHAGLNAILSPHHLSESQLNASSCTDFRLDYCHRGQFIQNASVKDYCAQHSLMNGTSNLTTVEQEAALVRHHPLIYWTQFHLMNGQHNLFGAIDVAEDWIKSDKYVLGLERSCSIKVPQYTVVKWGRLDSGERLYSTLNRLAQIQFDPYINMVYFTEQNPLTNRYRVKTLLFNGTGWQSGDLNGSDENCNFTSVSNKLGPSIRLDFTHHTITKHSSLFNGTPFRLIVTTGHTIYSVSNDGCDCKQLLNDTDWDFYTPLTRVQNDALGGIYIAGQHRDMFNLYVVDPLRPSVTAIGNRTWLELPSFDMVYDFELVDPSYRPLPRDVTSCLELPEQPEFTDQLVISVESDVVCLNLSVKLPVTPYCEISIRIYTALHFKAVDDDDVTSSCRDGCDCQFCTYERSLTINNLKEDTRYVLNAQFLSEYSSTDVTRPYYFKTKKTPTLLSAYMPALVAALVIFLIICALLSVLLYLEHKRRMRTHFFLNIIKKMNIGSENLTYISANNIFEGPDSTVLGEGQHGRVVSAKYFNPASKEVIDVAVKKLEKLDEYENKNEKSTLFFAEAIILSRISELHENSKSSDSAHIIKFYGVCIESAYPMLVLELVEGLDLKTYYIARSKMRSLSGDIDANIRICLQVAQALQFLHRNGIIHRDIKPDNVMCKLDNAESIMQLKDVKLSDFGLARFIGDSDLYSITYKTRFFKKTIPPEACAGYKYDNGNLDCLSYECDVWMFGLMLWSVFNEGSEPFENYSFCDIRNFITGDKPMNSVFTFSNSCPTSIVVLFHECCQKDAKRRPQFDYIVNSLELAWKHYLQCHGLSFFGYSRDVPQPASVRDSGVEYANLEDYVEKQIKCPVLKWRRRLSKRKTNFLETIFSWFDSLTFKRVLHRRPKHSKAALIEEKSRYEEEEVVPFIERSPYRNVPSAVTTQNGCQYRRKRSTSLHNGAPYIRPLIPTSSTHNLSGNDRLTLLFNQSKQTGYAQSSDAIFTSL